MLDDLAPQIRKECLRFLCNICSHQTLLPRALQLPLLYDPMEYPVERDEFADVWKVRYNGQQVAVRVLSVNPRSRLDRIASVGRWRPWLLMCIHDCVF